MTEAEFISQDDLRAMFASALSDMYRREVPQYGALLDLVTDVNQRKGRGLDPSTQHRMEVERHGAIRLGTASELAMMRRLFSIMGMQPVGYYDLTVADLPIHATCFRPLTTESISYNPFRVFTSLLRLDLITEQSLRDKATSILRDRQIYSPRCVELIQKLETCQVLPRAPAEEFLREAIETFRWHKTSPVDTATYRAFKKAHPLIADIVCFRGPHINHLTPRVLDIEEAQVEMQRRGLNPKAVIEGPPQRNCPVLLRQTSFLALEEEIAFAGGSEGDGKHKARFGEIEERGMALTPKGRRLFDELIHRSRDSDATLSECFKAFPDHLPTLRRENLAYFTYKAAASAPKDFDVSDWELLIGRGVVTCEPVTYEDFLPISAAGIFHSNFGGVNTTSSTAPADRTSFEMGLGSTIQDEFELYKAIEDASISKCIEVLARSS